MALPKIKHPLFKLVVPSTGKTISYRPFTVMEEKLLLIVRMSDDIDEVIDAIKQLINNCVVDEDFDIDKMAMFDVEYIFINLRRVSIGNVVELIYTDEDKKYPFSVDLEQVKVNFENAGPKNIDLGDGLGIMMKYPNMTSVIKVEFDLRLSLLSPTDVEEGVFKMILDCVDYVYDDQNMYKDFTQDELRDFVLSLSLENLEKLHLFFKNLPAVEHIVEVKVNDETRRVTLRGMKDFFTF